MPKTALEGIKENGMMPNEFNNREIPPFTLRLNAPHLLAETKPSNNKAYNHHKEQGKKAFHFKAAKADVSYCKLLSSHAHQLRLKMK
jgi:hypothetical protein